MNLVMRNKKSTVSYLWLVVLTAALSCSSKYSMANAEPLDAPPIEDPDNIYTWPAEDERHVATWLQWPHNNGWDPNHVKRYQDSWVALTKALHKGEKVKIIVYNDNHRRQVRNRLKREGGINMKRIKFYVQQTNDVWIRDNGPIFVFNKNKKLVIEDWGFNGWGRKSAYFKDDAIPRKIAQDMNKVAERVPFINEGGSIEVDGRGTLMAKRSSILNNNRNPGVTQVEAEAYFRRYLGVTNFIWLDGVRGQDITDDHIDGTARFANGDTVVTYYRKDFLDRSEYWALANAKDADGNPYNIVHLPITKNKVSGVFDYGIYINYYVGNDVVIVPFFNDPNDQKAADILKGLYPSKEVVGIDFIELYKDGGLVHCVTMQQPAWN